MTRVPRLPAGVVPHEAREEPVAAAPVEQLLGRPSLGKPAGDHHDHLRRVGLRLKLGPGLGWGQGPRVGMGLGLGLV